MNASRRAADPELITYYTVRAGNRSILHWKKCFGFVFVHPTSSNQTRISSSARSGKSSKACAWPMRLLGISLSWCSGTGGTGTAIDSTNDAGEQHCCRDAACEADGQAFKTTCAAGPCWYHHAPVGEETLLHPHDHSCHGNEADLLLWCVGALVDCVRSVASTMQMCTCRN